MLHSHFHEDEILSQSQPLDKRHPTISGFVENVSTTACLLLAYGLLQPCYFL